MIFRHSNHGAHEKQGSDKRRKALMLSALTACALVFSLLCVFSSYSICYAVSYGGQVVGQVSSRAELTAAIEEADSLAGEILGEEHYISQCLSVTATVGTVPESAEELAGKLIESVDSIVNRCCVYVDGSMVGAIADDGELQDILDAIAARYTTDSTVSVGIRENVTYEYALINAELESDPEELAWLLDPNNGESQYRLTVVSRESSASVASVPHGTVVTYDPEGYSDEVEHVSDGQDGLMVCSYSVELENGQVVGRHLTGTQVTVEPQPEEITVGALPGSRTDSRGFYIWPTTGLITSEFGGRETDVGSADHSGLDIGNTIGTDVWAADGGDVIYAGDTHAGYGLLVKVLHDNGQVTCYAHLSRILVSVGDRVAQGDVIARMGDTGDVTGPHLHFEIRPDGENPVDPMRYMTGWPEFDR